MLGNSFSKKIYTVLAKLLLNKMQAKYRALHGKELPILVIAGDSGKSTLVTLLDNLFCKNKWTVYKNIDQDSGVSSISLLCSTIGGIDMPASSGWFSFPIFIWRATYAYLFGTFKYDENTILIHEANVDAENRVDSYLEIFGSSVDTIIISCLIGSCASGFSDTFEDDKYTDLKKLIPDNLQLELEKTSIDSKTRNGALEKLRLLKTAKNYILPGTIDSFDNITIHNFDGRQLQTVAKSSRGRGFSLDVMDGVNLSGEYLLPQTFAKYTHILSEISKKYTLKSASVQDLAKNMALPNSRFGLLKGILNGRVVDSSYDTDAVSLVSFLDLLKEVLQIYSKADFDTDEYAGQVMAPRHYIVLGDMARLGESSKQRHAEILDSILDIKNDFGDYVEEVYLVGDSWLECDEQGFGKLDGNISYIIYKKTVFKVCKKAENVIELLGEDTVRPQSWYWVKGTKTTGLESVAKHLLRDKDDIVKLCRQG